MQYSNRHLIEVNCAFQFIKESIQWDNTFFGRFYERILDKGFTEKEQRKGVQIRFGLDLKRNLPMPPSQDIEEQVIFKNKNGMAIIMAKNKISFHILSNYSVWENFVSNLIEPFSEIYKKLGLGNGERQCNIVYLNRFSKSGNENLSDYFTIISSLGKNLGVESITNVQRIVDNGENLLIAKLNSQLSNNLFNINLECGAINKDNSAMNGTDWIDQANKTHKPVNDFFESIITSKLRTELLQ